MKQLFLIFTIFLTHISFANENTCLTDYPRDLMYCNEKYSGQVTVHYYEDAKEFFYREVTEKERFRLIEETVRLLADESIDERFDYEPDYSDYSTALIFPLDGSFLISMIQLNQKYYYYVHWQDSDDSSYSLLFTGDKSPTPIYINYEN